MAGRGRGRGRGSGLSFNLDALGIQRGEVISNPGRQVTIFPPLKFQPLPLEESDESLLELKVQIRQKFQQSPFYITKEEKKRDVERYSDKYQNGQHGDNWAPDWSQFPHELKPKPVKRKRPAVKSIKPNLKKARLAGGNTEDILSKLEDLEKTTPGEEEPAEEEQETEEEEKEGEEQEGEEEDEFADEEETDYNLTYFDNGEGYGDEEDEDDEPSYS